VPFCLRVRCWNSVFCEATKTFCSYWTAQVKRTEDMANRDGGKKGRTKEGESALRSKTSSVALAGHSYACAGQMTQAGAKPGQAVQARTLLHKTFRLRRKIAIAPVITGALL